MNQSNPLIEEYPEISRWVLQAAYANLDSSQPEQAKKTQKYIGFWDLNDYNFALCVLHS